MSHWAFAPPLIMPPLIPSASCLFYPLQGVWGQQNISLSMKLTVLFVNRGLHSVFPGAPWMSLLGGGSISFVGPLHWSPRWEVKMWNWALMGPLISLCHNAELFFISLRTIFWICSEVNLKSSQSTVFHSPLCHCTTLNCFGINCN